jgi:hypothetical protein
VNTVARTACIPAHVVNTYLDHALYGQWSQDPLLSLLLARAEYNQRGRECVWVVTLDIRVEATVPWKQVCHVHAGVASDDVVRFFRETEQWAKKEITELRQDVVAAFWATMRGVFSTGYGGITHPGWIPSSSAFSSEELSRTAKDLACPVLIGPPGFARAMYLVARETNGIAVVTETPSNNVFVFPLGCLRWRLLASSPVVVEYDRDIVAGGEPPALAVYHAIVFQDIRKVTRLK